MPTCSDAELLDRLYPYSTMLGKEGKEAVQQAMQVKIFFCLRMIPDFSYIFIEQIYGDAVFRLTCHYRCDIRPIFVVTWSEIV